MGLDSIYDHGINSPLDYSDGDSTDTYALELAGVDLADHIYVTRTKVKTDLSEDIEEGENEALIKMDEENMFFDEPIQYPPQPEVEHGFPKVCYCGGQPFIASWNNKRFFTCPNVDDGEMHIHKWWEDAVMEEMRDVERRYQVVAEKVDSFADIIQVRDHNFAIEQKMVHLETLISELGKKGNRFRKDNLCLVVAVVVLLVGIVVRRLM